MDRTLTEGLFFVSTTCKSVSRVVFFREGCLRFLYEVFVGGGSCSFLSLFMRGSCRLQVHNFQLFKYIFCDKIYLGFKSVEFIIEINLK